MYWDITISSFIFWYFIFWYFIFFSQFFIFPFPTMLTSLTHHLNTFQIRIPFCWYSFYPKILPYSPLPKKTQFFNFTHQSLQRPSNSPPTPHTTHTPHAKQIWVHFANQRPQRVVDLRENARQRLLKAKSPLSFSRQQQQLPLSETLSSISQH